LNKRGGGCLRLISARIAAVVVVLMILMILVFVRVFIRLSVKEASTLIPAIQTTPTSLKSIKV
jgi:hypothetical protein